MSAQISAESLAGLPLFLRQLLANPPNAGDGLHFWIFRVARHLLAHLDERSTFELIKAKASNCGRLQGKLEREIVQQIQGARPYVWQPKFPKAFPHLIVDHALPPIAPQPAWPEANSLLITSIVEAGPTLADLFELSPVRFDDDAPSQTEQIIDILFPGDPLLCVGKTQYLFATRRREVWRGHLARLPLIVPSPMLDYVGRTADGHWSEHTKQQTARRVYLVIEFDFSEYGRDHKTLSSWAPLVREWRAQGKTVADACIALHLHLAQRLPLVCITSSGGKSLHGWFYVLDRDEANLRSSFMNYAVTIGADKATWTPSQFVRIADGRRENGKRQSCYYLDPEKAVNL
jgi:hypothetical protein